MVRAFRAAPGQTPHAHRARAADDMGCGINEKVKPVGAQGKRRVLVVSTAT